MKSRSWLRKFPLKYRHLYTLSHWLKNKSSLSNFIWTALIFVTAISISHYSKSPQQASYWSLLALLCIFILSKLFRYLIVHFIKNTGSKNQFIMPEKYLVKNIEKKMFSINLNEQDNSNFVFADIENALYSAEINLKCYANGAWDTHLEEKYKRNVSHIQKNPNSFLLVNSKGSRPRSFTQILPVPEWAWEKYINGEIKDNFFSANYITSNSEQKAIDKAYGLILFSVGSLDYQKTFQRNRLKYRKLLGDLLEKAIAFHIKTHLDLLFEKGKKVPVLLQNESSIYSRFLKGAYSENSKKSGDGASILIFYVYNE